MKDAVQNMKNEITVTKTGESHMRQQRDEKDLLKLENLLRQSNKNLFAIGDEILNLVETKKWKVGELAQRFNYKRNRLSELYLTAKAFPASERNYALSFSHYELARKASSQFSSKWTPQSALKEIEKDRRLNQRRDVTRHFANLIRKEENTITAEKMANLFDKNSIVDNCHFEDCRTVAERLPVGSIKIAFFDPPYGDYGCYKNGKHNKSSASHNGFRSGTTDECLALTEDMFRILHPQMKKGGVMLLCRPGGFVDTMHSNIIAFAKKYDWMPYRILTWHKGKTKLGNGTEPYTTDTESIWVLHRSGDTIINHNNSSRSVVLPIRPVSQKEETADEAHLFEKPVELGKFLIDKHSCEGELVFDVCGCSGNFCVAAVEKQRRFVYCEIDEVNFKLGQNNITKALSAKTEKEIK